MEGLHCLSHHINTSNNLHANPDYTNNNIDDPTNMFNRSLLPPHTVLSILDSYAESLLLDTQKLALLKSNCLTTITYSNGSSSSDVNSGIIDGGGRSILRTSDTILSYMTWGIKHIEKAAHTCVDTSATTTSSSTTTSSNVAKFNEHLEKAEQMLRSLTDSLKDRLKNHNAPNPSIRGNGPGMACNSAGIVAAAHLFMALVWSLRRTRTRRTRTRTRTGTRTGTRTRTRTRTRSGNAFSPPDKTDIYNNPSLSLRVRVASHILQAFVVCPNSVRTMLAPELWEELFRPHLSDVEAWYRREKKSIHGIHHSHAEAQNMSVFTPNHVASDRGDSMEQHHQDWHVTDLVDGMKDGINVGPNSNGFVDTNQQVHSTPGDIGGDKFERMLKQSDYKMIRMRANLLSDLYQQSLDDGTQQFAKSYQDIIANYVDDDSESAVSGPENSFLAVSEVEVNEDDDHEEGETYQTIGSYSMTEKNVMSRDRIGHYIFRDGSSPSPSSSHEPLKLHRRRRTRRNKRVESEEISEFVGNLEEPNRINKVLKKSISETSLMRHKNTLEHVHVKTSTNSLRLTKKAPNNITSTQVNLLRMCSKVYRPEVLDPLRNMLSDARLIGRAKSTRGRSTVLKTLLSPHRHSASSNISGLLSAPHLKPLKARNSNSIRLIDLMTQQESSGSGSDFDQLISTSAVLHTTTKHNSGEHGQRRQYSTSDILKAKGDRDQCIKTSLSIKGEKSSKKRTARMHTNNCNHNSRPELRQRKDTEIKPVSGRSRQHQPVTTQNVNTQRIRPDVHSRVEQWRQTQSDHEFTGQPMRSRRDNFPACCRPPAEQIKPKHGAQEHTVLKNIGRTHMKLTMDDPSQPLETTEYLQQTSPNLEKSNSGHVQAQFNVRVPPALDKASTSANPNDYEAYHIIKEMATKLEDAVATARIRSISSPCNGRSSNMAPAIAKCEQALLNFTDEWLNLRVSTDQVDDLAHQDMLDELIDEFLYVLGVSELQEVQIMALCLLSSTAMANRKMLSNINTERPLARLYTNQDNNNELESGLGVGFSSERKLSSDDPQVLQALSNLLKQPTSRLPEAALLLHLLHPGRYAETCDHHLPHLLPLLLGLVAVQYQSNSKQYCNIRVNSKYENPSSPIKSPLNHHLTPPSRLNSPKSHPNTWPRSNSPKPQVSRRQSPYRRDSSQSHIDPNRSPHNINPHQGSLHRNSNYQSPRNTNPHQSSLHCKLNHLSLHNTNPHQNGSHPDLQQSPSQSELNLIKPVLDPHQSLNPQMDPHQSYSHLNLPYPSELHQNPLYQSSNLDQNPSKHHPRMTPRPSSDHNHNLSLRMIAHLLQVADSISRTQACKHVLLSERALLFLLLEKLMDFNQTTTVKRFQDTEVLMEERMAAAFILTACIRSDDDIDDGDEDDDTAEQQKQQKKQQQEEHGSFRMCVVKRVEAASLLHLLQRCSSASIAAFQIAIDFATEVLCPPLRISHMREMLPRDDMFNCMHDLMSYIQLAPPENQPLASGLLLQLDLLLGDEQRYNIFREEAIDALLTPLLCDTNKEACLNATHVLCRIGSSHSQHELESWLLKKAGLASPYRTTPIRTTKDNPSSSLSCYGSEEEETDTFLGNWDEIVSQAVISHKRGLQVSCALEKGLKSNLGGEVRRACVLVVAWLTSHLTINNVSSTTTRSQSHVRGYDIMKLSEDLKQLAQAIQPQLRSIAATNSPYDIEERVFAALALQNLGVHSH